MNIEISGVNGVVSALNAKISQVNKGIEKGVALGGKIVEGEAKANCPVDTGALRASITSQSNGNTAIIGTNKEYAAYLEFGTYKMTARPYLVPVLKSKQSEIIAAIVEAVKNEK